MREKLITLPKEELERLTIEETLLCHLRPPMMKASVKLNTTKKVFSSAPF